VIVPRRAQREGPGWTATWKYQGDRLLGERRSHCPRPAIAEAIPGTLVPGLRVQNYKRPRQKPDFSVHLSQSHISHVHQSRPLFVLCSRHALIPSSPLPICSRTRQLKMTAFNLSGFLAQTRVTISFDPSSSLSKISPSVVHTLDLAANLCRDSGRPSSRRLLLLSLGSDHWLQPPC
jgi:hypothetical protein